MNNTAVEAIGVVKTYEGGNVKALDGINLEVFKGEYLAILGPSGSGKSTLLNLIGALDYPTRGKIIIDGVSLSEAPSLDAIRARKIGFVFQLHNLVPTLTAWENVELPMYPLGVAKMQRRKRAEELLNIVGLTDRMNFIVTKLSGGERQRVAIARALANNPSLILADEPTGNLDSGSGTEVLETLMRIRKECNTTLVIVTHNSEIAERADRRIEIMDGKIKAA